MNNKKTTENPEKAKIDSAVLRSLAKLGERLRANRVHAGWTINQTAQRLFCSPNTYRALEAGKPTASIGNLASLLWLLGQDESINSLVRVPVSSQTKQRVRRSNHGTIAGVITEDERDF